MATTSEIAKRYFAALSARDLDAAVKRIVLGHADPVTGEVRSQPLRVAPAPL